MGQSLDAMDGVDGFTNWTAEIARLEGQLALARSRLLARLVKRELDGDDPSLIDQSMTELGRNNHIRAVRRRMRDKLPGAFKRGRRYLLTQEAYAEELGGPGPSVANVPDPPPPEDAESLMMAKLAKLRGRR